MRQRRGFIEATGTRRRLQALALAGWTAARVGQRLGVIQRNISRVRHGDIRRVRATFAASVALLYDAEAGRPDLIARADRELPSGKAWLPARMWTPQTIDDPHADPLAPMAQPIGVRRRLQALAYIGQGPAQVGGWINESAAVVQEWTLGGAVPQYAAHLIDAVYRRWQATPGPDAQARQLEIQQHDQGVGPKRQSEGRHERHRRDPEVQAIEGPGSITQERDRDQRRGDRQGHVDAEGERVEEKIDGHAEGEGDGRDPSGEARVHGFLRVPWGRVRDEPWRRCVASRISPSGTGVLEGLDPDVT